MPIVIKDISQIEKVTVYDPIIVKQLKAKVKKLTKEKGAISASEIAYIVYGGAVYVTDEMKKYHLKNYNNMIIHEMPPEDEIGSTIFDISFLFDERQTEQHLTYDPLTDLWGQELHVGDKIAFIKRLKDGYRPSSSLEEGVISGFNYMYKRVYIKGNSIAVLAKNTVKKP